MSDSLAGVPSAQLLARVRELVARSNQTEADLLAHLGEVDARRLYLEGGSRTKSHSVGDITLRCRAHNQLRARLDFWERHMAQFRRSATGFESSSPHDWGHG